MNNLIRKKFVNEQLTDAEVIRLAVIKKMNYMELNPHVGDMFFYARGQRLVRITKFEVLKRNHQGHEYEDHKIFIEDYDIGTREWFIRDGYNCINDSRELRGPAFTGNPEKYLDEAIKAIQTGNISKYKFQQSRQDEEETGLMHIGSKESLEVVKEDLENTVNQINIISGFSLTEQIQQVMVSHLYRKHPSLILCSK